MAMRPPRSRRRTRRLLGALALVVVFAGAGATAAWLLGGYRTYVVHTGSMEPGIVPGDVVIDAPLTGPVRPGDVITFRDPGTAADVVTHRVASVAADGTITTKGDANRTADPVTLRPDLVQGRVVTTVPVAGYLVVYLQHPTGLGSLATTTLGVALLWRLFFPGEDAAARAPSAPVRRRSAVPAVP